MSVAARRSQRLTLMFSVPLFRLVEDMLALLVKLVPAPQPEKVGGGWGGLAAPAALAAGLLYTALHGQICCTHLLRRVNLVKARLVPDIRLLSKPATRQPRACLS